MAFSADEILDVVDVDDQVVNQLSRGEIHARGLLHRSVHILLYDSANRLFVQKRSDSKDTNAGLWDTSAAGHVDAGEQPLDAAVRELSEELGVELDSTAFESLAKLPPDPHTGNEFVSVYRVASDQELTLEPGEIDEGRWFDRDSLAEAVRSDPARFTEVFRRILERVHA